MSALDGVRVVERADESAAFCGKLLAGLGAEVLKVEPPGGDRSRRIEPFVDLDSDPHRSVFFHHYNAAKSGVVLDLQIDRDRQQFEMLVDAADVLLLSGGPADLRRCCLDLDALRRNRPSLIVAVVSPFGQNGPRCDWKSSDLLAQAAGGMLWVNGRPSEPPLRAYGLQAYHMASLQAAIGIVLALRERERTGRGQFVDVSLQESVVAALEHVGASFHSTGRVESRSGTLHWAGGFRVCRSRDGLVCCSSVGDWTALVEWLKADAKAAELARPEWEDLTYRLEHAQRLFDVLQGWTQNYTTADLTEGAQLRRLPFAAVASPDDLPHHPQLRARRFFAPLPQPPAGRAGEAPGAPFRFSRTPWRIAPAPRLGGHTAALSSEGPRTSPPPGATRGAGRALEGLRVLDLTWVVAGPAATRILADHGADVIKVERRDALAMPNRRDGLTGNLNRGKRSIVIDLACAEGQALLHELVRRSDVWIDNFAPRVLDNWRLDDAALRLLNPKLVAVHMSAFGRGGPLGDQVGYGPTLQAIAGHTRRMRHRGGEPAGWGFSFSDMASASLAALAVLAALRHRERTGEAQDVDLSQLEALASLNGPDLLAAALAVPYEPVLGNESAERPAAPHGVYRCRDREGRERWCAIGVFDDDEWRRLVAVVGEPAWAADLDDARSRRERRAEIDARIADWTRTQIAEELVEALQTARIGAALVSDAEDLCLRDPQLAARGAWTRVTTPEGRTVTYDAALPRLSETPGRIAAAAPLAGEHTDEILRQIVGLCSSDIARLRNAGVVA